MQFANCSRNICWKKIVELLRGKYCGENFTEIFVAENCFSTDNLLKYKQLNTACNNGLHQLLGLRLLFSSSWKIIWCLQLYLSKKFSSFVLVSDCSSNWCKPHTLTAIYFFPQAEKKLSFELRKYGC